MRDGLENAVERSKRWPISLPWAALCIGLVVLLLWLLGFFQRERWKIPESESAARLVSQPEIPGVPSNAEYASPLGTDSSASSVPLSLHLTGTRLGRNSHEGHADIGVYAQTPQTYAAGAVLANGARLSEIYSDSVMLERNGDQWRLYVDGQESVLSKVPATSPIATIGGAAPVPPASADSSDALTDVVRIAPIFADDQVRAIEIYPGAQPDQFARLGLEPGDRIVAIDRLEVRDLRKAIEALRQVTAGAALILTIVRDGKRKDLSVDGSALQVGGRS